MKVVFMGTSSFALPSLKAILENKLDVVAVYTQPPRRAGRGKKMRLSPIGKFGLEHNLKLLYPENFSNPSDYEVFKSLKPDFTLVVAYGLILPKELLSLSKRGFFNVHASILPRWRGAAPIQRALLSGDKKTGVSLIKVEPTLDTGPVIIERHLKIGISDTAGLLHDRLSSLGASVTNYLCKNIDCLKLKNQNIEGITYASKIEKFEMQIDWFLSAELVDRKIRAFSPKPGAWFDLDGERIKILECQVSDGKDRPGVIMDASFQIACSSGSILPKVIQRSGKLPLPIKEFLTGFKVPIGKILFTTNL